jgi:hypothetical protein
MGHKIVAEAARRLAPTGGSDAHRHDLFVADHQSIAADTQRMLVGWSSMSEMPAVEALENFVLGQFNGMVKMEHASLRFYPDERCAAVVVAWMAPTRRIEDAKKMARVAPDRYLEQGSKQIWEVRKAEDGTPFLVRKTDEDLDTLLSQRRQKAGATHKGVTASFATLKNAGYLAVDEGDTVRFQHKGLTKMGRVQRFDSDDNVFIKSGEEMCKVAAPAITEVVQKDPKTIQDYKAKSRAYFSKIFPSSYMSKWMRSAEAEGSENPQ